ncbi:lysozyme [Flagellimonas algicola]|uniref:Lysozyme n=1 Tax=Flagellimonas algicola TaxID=2583815 RepID=A0ABY2WNB4_9FLAO|nr:lysozyme [Allomuricauda algicola]TMU56474.1 lysozyme [Allomuricauda algicola]
MVTSDNGISLIKKHEGLELQAYKDPIGIWTIGYGHTKDVAQGQAVTKEEAEKFLREDLGVAEGAVKKYVLDKGIPLQQHQFDALVSLVFNVGQHNIFTKKYNNGFVSGSTLYNRLLVFDFDGAADRFLDFVRAGGKIFNGLKRRRADEKSLFLKKNSALIDAVFGAISGTLIMWVLGKAANVI